MQQAQARMQGELEQVREVAKEREGKLLQQLARYVGALAQLSDGLETGNIDISTLFDCLFDYGCFSTLKWTDATLSL